MSAPLLSWILVTLTGIRGRSIQKKRGGSEKMKVEKHFIFVFHAEHSGMAMHLKLIDDQ